MPTSLSSAVPDAKPERQERPLELKTCQLTEFKQNFPRRSQSKLDRFSAKVK